MDGRHAPGHFPSHAPLFAERLSETPPWSAGLPSQPQQAPEKNQFLTQSAPQRLQQNRQQFDNEIWPKVCVSGACLRNLVSSVLVISIGMLTLRCRAFYLDGNANLSGDVLVKSALLACFELCCGCFVFVVVVLAFNCFMFSRDPYLSLTAESAQPQKEEDCTIQ